MLVDRNKKNIITADEAKYLSSAIEEEGELSFPASVFVIGAVAGTIYRAQRANGVFQPSLKNRFLAKLNYSYASLVSLILWVGANNVDIAAGVCKNTKKDVLIVRLKPGCNVDVSVNFHDLDSIAKCNSTHRVMKVSYDSHGTTFILGGIEKHTWLYIRSSPVSNDTRYTHC